jgi:hypothetical protein
MENTEMDEKILEAEARTVGLSTPKINFSYQ